jgi:dienelactone hydrolase
MKLINLILVFLLWTLFAFSSKAQNLDSCQSIAKQSINWLKDNHAERLYSLFSEDLKAKMDLQTTQSLWSQINAQMGDFQRIDSIFSKRLNGLLVTNCILTFEKAQLNYKLTFNQAQQIAGIFFLPYSASKSDSRKASTSDYFIESNCSFSSDEILFPAMLCLPKQGKPIAMIVLVHGSGPNDMNESIGPNKIFEQLAHQLAQNGIGSLRYDKRTYLAANHDNIDISKLDFEHEVIIDATAASRYLSSIDHLKELPLYVLGHSLGAHAAPLIAKQTPEVDGIILLAGNARPLEDLILEQYQYLFARGGLSKAEKTEIKKIKAQVKQVKQLDQLLAKGQTYDLPLTNSAVYWQSLNHYQALSTAQSLNIPILILQGERDYQVSMKDFQLWKQSLSQSPNASFKSYPLLNHLFMKGEGPSYPEEYNQQGNISEMVISDIAAWIIQKP